MEMAVGYELAQHISGKVVVFHYTSSVGRKEL